MTLHSDKSCSSSRNFPLEAVKMIKSASLYLCVGDFAGRFPVDIGVFSPEVYSSIRMDYVQWCSLANFFEEAN